MRICQNPPCGKQVSNFTNYRYLGKCFCSSKCRQDFIATDDSPQLQLATVNGVPIDQAHPRPGVWGRSPRAH